MKPSSSPGLALALAALLSAFFPASLAAQEGAEGDEGAEGATGAAGSGASRIPPAPAEQVQSLTLAEFLREAVRTQPQVQEAYLQWLVRYRLAMAEQGAFEPAVAAQLTRDYLKRQNTAYQIEWLTNTEFFEDNEEYGLGLEGKLPTGGTYRIGGSVKKMENTYAVQGQFESFVGLSAEQPLLKGLTHGAPLAALRAARQERYIAFHEYRRQLMDTLSKAEQAYWSLAFAQVALRMEQDSVRIAENLARDAAEWVQSGRMSDLDLEEAQAELVLRQVRVADAAQAVRDAVMQLKLLMAGARAPEELSLVASDPLLPDFAPGADPEVERASSVQWALRAQPDFMVRQEQLRRDSVLLGYRQSQVLPELNLKGSYGLRGLGDTAAQSLEQVKGGSWPAWSLGLELRAPVLLGVRERNELQAAHLKKKLSEVQLQALEYEMTRSIGTMLQRAATLRGRVDSLNRVADAKRRLLEVEVARLEAGTSNIHQVYEAEEGVSEAQREVLRAIVRYRETLMQLAVTRGSVLKDQGLERLEGGQVLLADELLYRPAAP